MISSKPFIASTSPGLFVTGTDTQVGKTTVTAALGLALKRQGINIGVMKPVETGISGAQENGERSDGQRLHELLSPEDPRELSRPYSFERPLAPVEAARQEKRAIELDVLVNAYHTLAVRHQYMLVEGAGGVLAPLTAHQDVRDLIQYLQIPCLLISRTVLGAVNHTRLTLEALRTSGIHVLAIVLNETQLIEDLKDQRVKHDSTAELIRQYSPAPVFGPLPFQVMMEQDWESGVTTLSCTPMMQKLVTCLSPPS